MSTLFKIICKHVLKVYLLRVIDVCCEDANGHARSVDIRESCAA
jgi:hypothetical protein